MTDDEFGEKTVSILLDGEESEMVFIDHPHVEMSVSMVLVSKTLHLRPSTRVCRKFYKHETQLTVKRCCIKVKTWVDGHGG